MDKLCDVRVDIGLSRTVMVRERQAKVHAAVAFAVERAERAVERQLRLAGTALTGRPPRESNLEIEEDTK
jgi:hypothetical protein